MNLTPSLRHRATVARSVTIDDDGSPRQTWQTRATNVQCLWLPSDSLTDPTAAITAVKEAHSLGKLLTSPHADIKPGDRITLTRPTGVTLIVQTNASVVMGYDAISHREFVVRSA